MPFGSSVKKNNRHNKLLTFLISGTNKYYITGSRRTLKHKQTKACAKIGTKTSICAHILLLNSFILYKMLQVFRSKVLPLSNVLQ